MQQGDKLNLLYFKLKCQEDKFDKIFPVMKNLYALLFFSITLFNQVGTAQSFLDQVELTPLASLPQGLNYFRFKQASETEFVFFTRVNYSTSKFGVFNFNGNEQSWQVGAKYLNDKRIELVEHNGSYYIGTQSGLLKFSLDGNYELFDTLNSVLLNNIIPSIASDNQSVWLITENNGLARYQNGNFQLFNSSIGNFPDNNAYSIIKGSGNNIYVSSQSGLFRWSETAGAFTQTLNASLIPESAFVEAIIENGSSVSCYAAFNNYSKIIRIVPGASPEVIDVQYERFCEQELLWKSGSYVNVLNNKYFVFNDYGVAEMIKCIDVYGNYFNLNIASFFTEADGWLSRIYESTTSLTNENKLSFFVHVNQSYNFCELETSVLELQSGRPFELGPDTEQLNVNDFKTAFSFNGNWNINLFNLSSTLYYPACNSQSIVTHSSVWIGGKNNQGITKFSGNMPYDASDWVAGPLEEINLNNPEEIKNKYSRVWKIDRAMVVNFIDAFENGNLANGIYQIPEDILSYPGNPEQNSGNYHAPFFDQNNDGIYNPFQGDYPLIEGDMQLLSVFNDNSPHYNSLEEMLGVEVWHYAWAYKCDNEAIVEANPEFATNTSVFHKMHVINKSANDFHELYAGIQTTANAWNDSSYLGTIAYKNTQFFANHEALPIQGNPSGAPIFGVRILEGPPAPDGDLIDNDNDGTVDEPGEQCLLTSSMVYRPFYYTDPNSPGRRYPLMMSKWFENTHLTEGGDGRQPGNPEINHIFPGNPYNSDEWSEWSANQEPGRRIGIASLGPIQLESLESFEFTFVETIAYLPGQPNGENTSWLTFNNYLGFLEQAWSNSEDISCLNVVAENPKQPAQQDLSVFPVPATNIITVSCPFEIEQLIVCSMDGRVLIVEKQNGQKIPASIDISELQQGIYLIRVSGSENSACMKILKL